MMNRLLILIALAFYPLVFMGKVRVISNTTTYYADPNISVNEAKAAAIEQARVEALGREFGTLITQDILNVESDEQSYFTQLASAEVKGIWIEDLQEPVAKIVHTEDDGVLVIEASVKGKARPINNEAADFKALALRNGTEQRYAGTDFNEGDRFYLYFKAPSDGYVAAFLIDNQQQVFRILPHESSEGQQQVLHDREYVFFSEQHDPDFTYGDGMRVTCSDDRMELNRIYVIFSPKPFVKPVDYKNDSVGKDGLILPPQLSLKDFSRWMGKVYSNDEKMSRQIIRLRISKS